MIVRIIAETLTTIVAKSRFLRLCGAQGIISNRPSINLEAPTRNLCHTTLVVKQGVHGFPLYRRAHLGYLHLDFKAHTSKQARRKLKTFLQLQYVGQFTIWGYGALRWILQKSCYSSKASPLLGPQFRILKGLPPHLFQRERQLVMAALLHNLVDTNLHPSKLGHPLTIPEPYIQWLCENHHACNIHPQNHDLQLLQKADSRTSRYARLLHLPTSQRKMAPINTHHLINHLEQVAHRSVYQLYSFTYHSNELHHFLASKTHPTETLRNHLIGVANWILFLAQIHTSPQSIASASLAGQLGAIPGPVEMEDSWGSNDPFVSW